MTYWIELQSGIALLMCLGAGTVGGVFFAFSTFVMSALAQLPAGLGIVAMQRINVAVINVRFLGVFVGSAMLAIACIVIALVGPNARYSLLAAGLSYLVGSFGVTMIFNVPRNERLARLDASSADAADHWGAYVREWTWWNHVRTVASAISAACAAGSLLSW